MHKNIGRIERSVELAAPVSVVWEALTDYKQFGTWFHLKLKEPFRLGRVSAGKLDYPGLEKVQLELLVKELRPEKFFSYAWHPYAIDLKRDYSGESPTVVEFRLEPSGRGTRLSITESGFAALPPSRREEAYAAHVEGWAEQVKNLEKFLAEQAVSK